MKNHKTSNFFLPVQDYMATVGAFKLVMNVKIGFTISAKIRPRILTGIVFNLWIKGVYTQYIHTTQQNPVTK